MSDSVRIRFIDGTETPALLAHPFDPATGYIVVRAKEGGPHVCYSLSDLCSIEFGRVPEAFDHLAAADEVMPGLRQLRVGGIIAEGNDIPQEKLERTIKETKLPRNVRIGDILIAAGLVTREQIEAALARQDAGKRKRIGELLIEKGLITEDQLLAALATRFNLRLVDLERVFPDENTLSAFPYELASRLNIFPVESSDRHMVVATSTPTDPTISDTLRFFINRRIELVVARKQQIQAAIKRHYMEAGNQVKDLLVELKDKVVTVEEETYESTVSESDSQIINLVNRMLIEAYQQGASDIHFEPGPGLQAMSVRYRIDGICRIVHQIAATHKHAIVARIKIISRLDIAERRRPQSGKILIRFESHKLEYRVEITPTVGGCEDAVLRILSSSKPMPLEEMGFSPSNLRTFREMLTRPHGVILCVGATGSGKTTTLHSALAHINTSERKIWTAEDPVEITQPGLRQVQVHPKIGFSFSEALRSFLRADPDIIMIGEMRDLETAKIVVHASLTGHLVFSTLHTNSAPETISRLVEMGIEPINVAEAMVGVLAQRLVRRLCRQCKRPYHPDPGEYGQLVEAYGETRFREHGLPPYSDRLRLMQKTGCEACADEGYKGRLAIHELLSGTPAMKSLLKKAVPAEAITDLALTEGMRTLRMDGIYKVFQGEIDFEQVLRI
ncbi:MAG: Flp pilus assembly complex ATPase component TadA [Desulfuromonadales bacterium]|nr:Flp pilus assembly complex ATPase component TadA [Desulfuromonadales bacterium]